MAEDNELEGFIGGLPVAPPDPVGFLIWHSKNPSDLLVKGNNFFGFQRRDKAPGTERKPEEFIELSSDSEEKGGTEPQGSSGKRKRVKIY